MIFDLDVFTTDGIRKSSSAFSGTLGTSQGGTGQNLSSSTGDLVIDSGTVSANTRTGTGNSVRATSPTIVTPTIASFANATHNHADAAGGGTLTSAAISDFSEATDDRVNALLSMGTGLEKSYNDAGNILTLLLNLSFAQVRLTPTTGTPFPDSAVTAATHIYVTPYGGNLLTLYDGTRSKPYVVSSDIDLNLSGLTADTNYDYYVYDNSGTLTADSAAWSGNTPPTRALQDGYLVKSGTPTKRLIGSFRTTGSTGQTQFGNLKYYISNLYNRVAWDFFIKDTTTSWTDTGTAWKAWNGSNANRVEWINAYNLDAVNLLFSGQASISGAIAARIGVGLDSTSTPSGSSTQTVSTSAVSLVAGYSGRVGLGYHFLQLLQQSSGSTATFYGTVAAGPAIQTGGTGTLFA